MNEKEINIILDYLVDEESCFICDEMNGTEYCEKHCNFCSPQRSCYIEWAKMKANEK